MRRVVTSIITLSVVALAAMATAAYGTVPRWYWAPPLEEIPAGKAVPVQTSGTLVLTVQSASGKKIGVARCSIADDEIVENPASGGPGVDSMARFSLANCASKIICPTGAPATLQAVGLPWPSMLVAGAPPLDEINGVAIQELCGGAEVATFVGILKPEVKGAALVFIGAPSGVLTDGAGETITVKGADKLIGPSPKTKVTAK